MQDKSLKKIEELEKRKAKINAELIKIKANINKEERKKDTRRKILIGSAMMNLVKQGKFSNDELLSILDNFLDKDIDRKLFELNPKKNDK